jgi:hypothetical protein
LFIQYSTGEIQGVFCHSEADGALFRKLEISIFRENRVLSGIIITFRSAISSCK